MLRLPPQNHALIVASIDRNPRQQALAAKTLGADVLELRLDLLGAGNPGEAISLIREVSHAGLLCIATIRIPAEGGRWDGDEAKRLKMFEAILPHVDAVDIEMCASGRDRLIDRAKREQVTVIVSSHFFEHTPPADKLAGLFGEGKQTGADIVKIATMPQSPADVLELLEAAGAADMPVCAISMGKTGSYSRVVAPLYGSVLTYGCIGRPVAPGQLRIDRLKAAMEMLL
jgi:3-dehydroquinate dehydratase-1